MRPYHLKTPILKLRNLLKTTAHKRLTFPPKDPNLEHSTKAPITPFLPTAKDSQNKAYPQRKPIPKKKPIPIKPQGPKGTTQHLMKKAAAPKKAAKSKQAITLATEVPALRLAASSRPLQDENVAFRPKPRQKVYFHLYDRALLK